MTKVHQLYSVTDQLETIYRKVYLSQVLKIDKFVDYVFESSQQDYKQDVKDIIDATISNPAVLRTLEQSFYASSSSKEELETKLHLLLRMQTTNIVEVLKSHELHKGGSYKQYVTNRLRQLGKTELSTAEWNRVYDYRVTEHYFNGQEGLQRLEEELREIARGGNTFLFRPSVSSRDEYLDEIYRFYKVRIKGTVEGHDKIYYNGIYPKKLLINAYDYSLGDKHIRRIIEIMYDVVDREDTELSLLSGQRIRERHKVERVVKSVYNFYIEYYKSVMRHSFEQSMYDYLDAYYKSISRQDIDISYDELLQGVYERGGWDSLHEMYYLEHGGLDRSKVDYIVEQVVYESEGVTPTQTYVNGMGIDDIRRFERLRSNLDLYNKGKWQKNRINYMEFPGQYTLVIITDIGDRIQISPQCVEIYTSRTIGPEVVYQREGTGSTLKSFQDNVTAPRLRYRDIRKAEDLVEIIRSSYDFRSVCRGEYLSLPPETN